MNPARFTSRTMIAVLAATALLLTACGDDDDDSGSDASAIKIMSWTGIENPNFSQPQARTAAEARVEALNDNGGINGRPVELVYCDTRLDPNQEAACARQAVDEKVVAVLGATSIFPNTLPLLERAGIPYIGGQGATLDELSSPISYPLVSGTPGWFHGAVNAALQRGVQRPAIVVSPIASVEFAGEQAADALQAAGIPPARTVTAPVGAPDQAASAAQAADGTDGVIIAAVAVDAIKIVQSLRQANYPGVISSVTALFGDDALETLSSTADGMLLTSQLVPATDTSNPGISRFITQMAAADPGAAKDEIALRTWASIDLWAELVERMSGQITASSVLDAMNDLSDPIDIGVTAPYAVEGRTSPIAEFPRIFNPTIVYNEVKDGRLTRVTEGFPNPFADPTG